MQQKMRHAAELPPCLGPQRCAGFDRASYSAPTFWRRWRLSQPTGIGTQKVTSR